MSAKSVLFVDDEPHVLAALRDLLRPQRVRWSMRFADGPDEALREMERADWSQGDAHRAHAVLKKPCDPAALVQAIEGAEPTA